MTFRFKSMKKIRATFLFLLVFAGAVFAAPPDWLADPGNSRWAVCGGEANGVTVDHSDGTLKPVPGGLQAIGADGQPSNFYVLADPWDKFRAWLGDRDVLLTVRYFDGGAGTMGIHYDSSDASVKADPNACGVWRAPEDYPNGVPLTGSKTWKTLSVRLPLAFFTKRANGGDVRIEGQGKDFSLGGMAFTRVAKGPELPVKQALFADPPADQPAAEFWTVPVAPFDVAQWRRVTFDMPATVHCEYSIDSGKSWTPFDPKNDLTGIAVTGGGKDRLQFHLKDTGPFHFGGGVLTYQAGPHNTCVVENARMKVEVDPFGIKSILDKKTGRMAAEAAPFHAAMISFLMKKPGASSPFRCDLYEAVMEKCEVGGSSDAPELTMTHHLNNGLRVTTTGKLLPNGQSEWQMAIDNATDFEVAEFRFPVVTGIRLGGEPADEWMFVPKAWGQIVQDPAGDGVWADTNQNASTPMQWTALWNGKQGLYVGIEDPRHEDYSFGYGGDASGGETVAPWQRTLAKPRGQWKSGIYRIALTGGDWHEAADIYRDYAARTIQPTDVTPVVKWQVDAWRLQESNNLPYAGWDVIQPGGSPLMAANRQMLDGADSGYCGLYPLPCLAWGSLREFSQKIAVRRALGGLYTPYHNFHMWSPSYGHYQRVGSFPKSRIPAGIPIPDDAWYARGAEKSYTGQYVRDETNYFAQDGMAMASPEWSGWMTDWTRRYIDWGADGMYYDQFNMMYPNGWLYPGYDTYGCWMQAEIKTISGIRQAARAKNPYYTSSGEVCNAIYGQYLDLHMTSGVWNRLDVFRYAMPYQLLIDGVWNSGEDVNLGGPERERFIWQVGARFDHEPAAPYLGILPLRRAVKSLLYDATFRDTVGVTVHDATGQPIATEYVNGEKKWQYAPVRGVNARWFLYDRDGQKGAIVNLINAPVRKGATCTIDTKEFGPVTSVFAVTLDGARMLLAGKQEGDTFTFPVPEAEYSSVVLAGHLAPLVEWSIDPAATPGVIRQLHLKLTNANAGPLSGTATFRLPAGWAIPPAVQFGPIAGGQAQSLTIPLHVPADAAKGRTDVWCDVATPSGNFAAYNLLVVNDPVVADFRGNPGDYHLWLKNLTAAPLTGTISVQGQAGLTVSAPATVALPPDSETNVPVDVKGQDKLPEIGEISASIAVGSQKIDLVRGVMPTVPNRDFESDAAGDLKPDWWMCRKVGDDWSYERMHLAAGAHGGKYCLQLDPPQATEKYIYAYPVDSAFRPGAHYRVSVWIKSASATGVYAQLGGGPLGSGQTGPEWKQFTSEFTCSPSPAAFIGLRNESLAPAFFDDIVIEEVAPH